MCSTATTGRNVTERAALLYLLRHSGRRWSAVAEEVEERRSAVAIVRDGPHGQLDLLASKDPPDQSLDAIEHEIAEWEQEGMRFVMLLDREYPGQLLMIHQRPPFLMWRGGSSDRDARGVAIVGTRKATPEGLQRAEELAAGLARRGITVVSGLAAGIDTAAHIGALDAGGRTVAVIGTGLRRSYPPQNAKLQDRIATEGMVISQFLPDAPPTKTSFPMRNAVMSGYAAATVVVEANWKSGARMQARLALEHGRHVFLLESLLKLDWAQDYARRPGATVVRDVDDLVQQLEAITAPRTELVWA
jgi:DNA processing protein